MKTSVIQFLSTALIIVTLILIHKFSGENERKNILVNSKDQVDPNSSKTSNSHATIELDTESFRPAGNENNKDLKSAIKKGNTLEYSSRAEESLNNFLLSLVPAPQVFTVSGKDRSFIKGLKGSVIFINPKALETIDGLPVSESIRIELTEVLTKREMIMNGINTRSGDSLLISGGMYRIEMFSGKSKLRIKEGESLHVKFPKIQDDLMSLFYGEEDSKGNVNWVFDDTINNLKNKYSIGVRRPDGNKQEVQYLNVNKRAADSLNNLKQEYYRKYSQIEYWDLYISRLEWINVDKFISIRGPRTSMYLTSSNDSIEVCKCFIVFKKINAQVSQTNVPFSGKLIFGFLPVGQEVTILAIGYYDTIPFIAEDIVSIKNNITHEIVFKRTTEEEIIYKINQISY